ncbi:MAG: phospholipase [Rhodobacteraceae bacterium]|nr:phospholipase [Paracoccaceae bacterium]
MMRELRVNRAGAGPGQAQRLVVFLHGYGADGADLLGLSDVLAPHLPDTAFVAPDGPERPRASPFGYQWFPVPWIDGSSEAEQAAGLAAAAEDIDGFLTAEMAHYGVGPDQTVVFGFSQGAMMALHVAPRRPSPLAGVVAIAGRLLLPERLGAEGRSKPPVLLIHGDQDPVVPFDDMARAGEGLTAAGFTVYGHVMRGTPHGIAPDGLGAALGFMRDVLGMAG